MAVKIKINSENWRDILSSQIKNVQTLRSLVNNFVKICDNKQLIKVYNLILSLDIIIKNNKDSLIEAQSEQEIQRAVNFTYRLTTMIIKLDNILYRMIQYYKKNTNLSKDEKMVSEREFLIPDMNFNIKVYDDDIPNKSDINPEVTGKGIKEKPGPDSNTDISGTSDELETPDMAPVNVQEPIDTNLENKINQGGPF